MIPNITHFRIKVQELLGCVNFFFMDYEMISRRTEIMTEIIPYLRAIGCMMDNIELETKDDMLESRSRRAQRNATYAIFSCVIIIMNE